MSPDSRAATIFTIGAFSQFGGTLLLMALFALLRSYGGTREHFRRWTWAWWAMAAGIAAAFGLFLIFRGPAGSSPRLGDVDVRALIFVYLGAKILFITLLWSGARAYAEPERWNPSLRVLVAGATIFALVIILGGVPLRAIPLWQAPVAVVCAIWSARLLTRASASRGGVGTRVVAVGFWVLAVLWATYFLARARPPAAVPTGLDAVLSGALLYNWFLDLLVELVLAFGMVVLLVEDATRDAERAGAGLREVQEQMRETSANLQSIVERAADFCQIIDEHHRILYISPSVEAVLGYRPDEVVGRQTTEFVHPDDLVRSALDPKGTVPAPGPRRRSDYTLRVRNSQGGWVELQSTSTPIQDGSGAIRFLVINRDLTGRERVREALLESERRYRSVVDSLSEGVLVVGTDRRIEACNPAAARILGRTEPQLVGSPLVRAGFDAHHDDGTPCAADEYPAIRTMRTGQPCNGILLKVRRADGEWIWLSINTRPLIGCDGQVSGVVSSFSDITDRRRAEEMSKASREMLEAIIGTQRDIAVADLEAGSISQLIVDRARELAQADGAVLLTPDGDDLTFRAGSGTAAPHVGFRLSLDSSLSGLCYRTGVMQRADDTLYDARANRRASALVSARTVVCVPLIHERRTIGVLNLISARPGQFQDRESDALMVMGGLLAAAMSHALDFDAKRALVAERTAALRALQESEQRFESAFRSSAIGVALVARDGRYLQVNPALCDILGYGEDELLRMRFSDITLPDELDDSLQWAERLFDGVVDRYTVEKRYVHRRGHVIWVSLNIAALPGADGARRHCVVHVMDISERKRAEAALRERDERFELVLRATNDVIYDWSITADTIEWGESVRTVLRYERLDRCDFSWWREAVHPDDLVRVLDGLSAALSSGHTSWEDEYRFRRGDGTWATLLDRGIIQRDAGGTAVRMLGAMADVSARRQLEDELRQGQRLETVGRLAGGVAHDFNNLLTAIRSYGELLLQSIEPADERHDDVRQILHAADRASALTSQLLAFSRRQVRQPRRIDLNTTVRGMEPLMRRLISEDIRLTTHLDPALFGVKADPGQLEQVMMNLVVNARDAMPGGGTLTITTVSVTLDAGEGRQLGGMPAGDYAMLAVRDTGHGMDASVRSRIFEPFFTTKEAGKGTGLGLATVYGIVEQSGGHIRVETEVGAGTTFSIYLPSHAGSDEESAPAVPAAESGDAGAGHETILLVEDDDAVRVVTRRILARGGYQVLEARNGNEALQICGRSDRSIDLVLTDVIMPEMSGRELATRLQPVRPGSRILFMSGYAEDAISRHGVLEEGLAFIEKPFSPHVLLRKIRDVIEQHPAGTRSARAT